LSVTTRIDNNSIYRGLSLKLESFGWNFTEIDGHNHKEITHALIKANISEKPFLILAQTIKGKGVSFMENNLVWHHQRPTLEQFNLAKKELNQKNETIKRDG
jgi:transketolase